MGAEINTNNEQLESLFQGDQMSDIAQLKAYLDDGVLDENDATDILENIEHIELDTQKQLVDMLKEVTIDATAQASSEKLNTKLKYNIELSEATPAEKKAIRFNNAEFTSEGLQFIQRAIGIDEANIQDQISVEAIQKIMKYPNGSDGMVGLGVLKNIGLVDKKNNIAQAGLSKDMFKAGKLEKGNSRHIKFEEKNNTEIPVVEKSTSKTEKAENITKQETPKTKAQEESILENIGNTISDTGESIATGTKEFVSDSVDTIDRGIEAAKNWLKNFLGLHPELRQFTGENGKKVSIRFNEETGALSIDTSFFDNVNDETMEKKFLVLDDIRHFETEEQAMKFVGSSIMEMKKFYDEAEFNGKVDYISTKIGTIEQKKRSILSSFKPADDAKEVDLVLSRNLDSNGKDARFESITLWVDAPFDGISDSKVTIEFKQKDLPIDNKELKKQADQLISKYKRLYAEKQTA